MPRSPMRMPYGSPGDLALHDALLVVRISNFCLVTEISSWILLWTVWRRCSTPAARATWKSVASRERPFASSNVALELSARRSNSPVISEKFSWYFSAINSECWDLCSKSFAVSPLAFRGHSFPPSCHWTLRSADLMSFASFYVTADASAKFCSMVCWLLRIKESLALRSWTSFSLHGLISWSRFSDHSENDSERIWPWCPRFWNRWRESIDLIVSLKIKVQFSGYGKPRVTFDFST